MTIATTHFKHHNTIYRSWSRNISIAFARI